MTEKLRKRRLCDMLYLFPFLAGFAFSYLVKKVKDS
jgi:hypothetical protein